MNKIAGSSQATWALLAEGTSAARLTAHELRGLVSRVLRLIEQSDHKEHLYQVAGDAILHAPKLVEELEAHLDRTSYALSVLGKDTLRETLPTADRTTVDNAVEHAAPLNIVSKVVDAYLKRKADLNPPLGSPGGVCHAIDRVETTIRNPKDRERLKDDLEFDAALSDNDVHKVYDPLVTVGPSNTPFKKMMLTDHGQYRMDVRAITVSDIRDTLQNFIKKYSKEKSQQSYLGKLWEQKMKNPRPNDEALLWTHNGLTVAFRVQGDTAVIVTAYWEGDSKPKPPGDGGCDEA